MEGNLYKFIGNKWLPYPPPSQCTALLKEAHLAVWHGQFKKTYNHIKDWYYWESLRLDLQEYLDNCVTCSQYQPLPKTFSYETNKLSSPFYQVSINIIGPLPKTYHSNKFIIVTIDHFTKWIEALAIQDVSSTTAALFLHNYIISWHRCPNSVLSNNGKTLFQILYLPY